MTNSFEELGLRPELASTVAELGYKAPTPIQAETIPLLLEGLDVLGQAQTGTGKTAAFALPMLQTLATRDPGVQGLVVTPTRELANQVAAAIHDYGRSRRVKVLPIYGGQSYSRQIGRLKRGVHIVVGTPGRMLDLIKKRALDLSTVRCVVLDEADEMLSMGFIEDIQAILSATPDSRQTALFSATLPAAIHRLADEYMHDPRAVTTSPKELTVAKTEQRYYVTRESDKVEVLTRLLELENVRSALIFTRTRAGAGDLAGTLIEAGFRAEALHGDLEQASREAVLGRFRRGQIRLLIATDVAARGLDIKGISHVFNYDLPYDTEYYVHRIGRTGRAGEDGVAISLVTPKERGRMGRIERFIRSPISCTKIPTTAQILQHRDDQFLDTLADQLAVSDLQRERALVDRLAESGVDPLDLAAAAIQLARLDEKQRPVTHIAQIKASPRKRSRTRARRTQPSPQHRRNGRGRKHEAGMVRLSMNQGKTHSIYPGEIVGAIAGTASIPGRAIGAIDINANQTYVDVAEQHVDKVIYKMRGWKLRGQRIILQRA